MKKFTITSTTTVTALASLFIGICICMLTTNILASYAYLGEHNPALEETHTTHWGAGAGVVVFYNDMINPYDLEYIIEGMSRFSLLPEDGPYPPDGTPIIRVVVEKINRYDEEIIMVRLPDPVNWLGGEPSGSRITQFVNKMTNDLHGIEGTTKVVFNYFTPGGDEYMAYPDETGWFGMEESTPTP